MRVRASFFPRLSRFVSRDLTPVNICLASLWNWICPFRPSLCGESDRATDSPHPNHNIYLSHSLLNDKSGGRFRDSRRWVSKVRRKQVTFVKCWARLAKRQLSNFQINMASFTKICLVEYTSRCRWMKQQQPKGLQTCGNAPRCKKCHKWRLMSLWWMRGDDDDTPDGDLHKEDRPPR